MISVVYLNVECFYGMRKQNKSITYCPLQICNTFVKGKIEIMLSQSCRHSKESLSLCYKIIPGSDWRWHAFTFGRRECPEVLFQCIMLFSLFMLFEAAQNINFNLEI